VSAAKSPPPEHPLFILGDVHGQYDVMRELLRGAGLIDDADQWSGGKATLWFMGDFFDRGPDGISSVDLVMRLQHEAAAAGGAVHSILGNHDVMILAAHRFGPDAGDGWGDQFWCDWELNGGQLDDLRRLTPRHVRWITGLPMLAKIGNLLLAHADAIFYLDYGDNIESINRAGGDILDGDGPASWDMLLDQFTQRRAFSGNSAAGAERLNGFLAKFGASRLIHGHTPIPLATGTPARQVKSPHLYADGKCVNVDAGLFLGSPGFVFRVPSEWL
jgi:hypothetical protein